MLEKIYDIMRDAAIVLFSIAIAVILVKTGFFVNILHRFAGIQVVASFFGGMFFVSVFTVAPATVLLIEAAREGSPWIVALLGGLGALLGDFLIFRFIRDSLSRSLLDIILNRESAIIAFFRKKFFRIFGPLLGALIIISPFPDEIGLMLMGLSDMNTKIFLSLSFSLNFIGILILGLLANL
jgi:hypothetical protein